ncbi:paraquat-inducible protein A [Mucilaginibacter sp. JRF]|uniref:paraquat-inducible protein A n=1 Tax=Mucilaginibacter sp. JRF TaxID=2780088 RepID=UPI0018806DC9|nr:paraquat-inducible protein A [Mucilaginibacter sp. JRF]MBE9584241.1 paraquat-inducible protein A [Mucilaginibacter sp. JRF]
MKYSFYTIGLLIGLSMLLAGGVFSAWRIDQLSAEREKIKEDYSLSNSVSLGLFSIDAWQDRIADVIKHQLQEFHITPSHRKDLQKTVENEMHVLVKKTVSEINRPQKSLGGKLKKMAFNALIDSAELQAQVRPFANTIVAKIASPKSERRLKRIAGSKLDQLTGQIYDSVRIANYAVTQYIYKKYQVNDPITFNKRVNQKLEQIDIILLRYVYGLAGSITAALALWWILRKYVKLQVTLFIFALLFALLLLITGTVVPVIEVDARIQSLELKLLGEEVLFQNQVLFYQNKSVMGIVGTLLSQSKPDTIVVGALILLFILILPLLRLIAKGIYVLSPKNIAQHNVIRYFTFELHKWDMADVMVVGMLMTYIGLNGILKSQLSALNIHDNSLKVVTNNGTSLQAGFYIFAGYVLFSALLSQIFKQVSPHDQL